MCLPLKWYIRNITSVILHHQFTIICAVFLVLNIKFNKYNNLKNILKTNNLHQREMQKQKNVQKRKRERKYGIFLLSYYVMSFFFFFSVYVHCLWIDIMSFHLNYYISWQILRINITIYLLFYAFVVWYIYKNQSTVLTNMDLMLSFELCFKLYEAIQETG